MEGEGQVFIFWGHPSAGQDGSWQHYSTIGMTGQIPFPTSNPDTTYIPAQILQSFGGCPFVHKLGDLDTHPIQGPTVPFFTEAEKSCSCLWLWGRYYCPPITDGKLDTREGLVSGRAGGLTLKPILSPPWCAVPPPLRSSWVSERGLRIGEWEKMEWRKKKKFRTLYVRNHLAIVLPFFKHKQVIYE